MAETGKERAGEAVAVGVGAGVGGAGGATVGVLELAAQGAATAVSAGVVIGLGAAAGGLIAYGIYRLLWKPRVSPMDRKHENPSADDARGTEAK